MLDLGRACGKAYAANTVEQDLVNRQELAALLDRLSGGSQRIPRRLPPVLEQPNAEERYKIFHDVLAKPILEWRRGDALIGMLLNGKRRDNGMRKSWK